MLNLKYKLIATVFLFVAAVTFGCKKESKLPTAIVTPMDTAKNAGKFLALGDSYTIGQSVDEKERFPYQTLQLLASENLNFSQLTYVARTGWTTTDLKTAIAAQNLQPVYQAVTLLIGVNDQYQRRDTTGYADRFEELLLTAIHLAAGDKQHVFVLSIPDYSVTPFVSDGEKAFVKKQVAEFNAINSRITNNYGIAYINITPISETAKDKPELIANDGLHPSGSQYQLWAAKLAPVIKKNL